MPRGNLLRRRCGAAVAVVITIAWGSTLSAGQARSAPFLSGVSSTTAGQEDPFVGIWVAEETFFQPQERQLRIARADGGFVATLDAETRVCNGEELSFDFGSVGRFRGHFDRHLSSISGHWIHPPTVNSNAPYATPLHFDQTSSGAAVASFTQRPDRATFFLRVLPRTSELQLAFLRNPQRNTGIRPGDLSVRSSGDDIAFLDGHGQVVIDGERKLDGDTATLELRSNLFHSDRLTFSRSSLESHFSPGPVDATYRYQVPPALDDGWEIADAAAVGMDSARLAALVQWIWDIDATSVFTPYIHSVLVAREGQLVLEEYFHGYSREDVHDTRSAGKSVASMLIGAIADRHPQVTLDRTLASIWGPRFAGPATESENQRDWRQRMTIGHALSMQSGLDADDSMEDSPGGEDRMQSQTAQPDWVQYGCEVPMARTPGAIALYASTSINLAAAAAADAADLWLPDAFERYLARPLGIHHYEFNLDPAGNGYMGGGIRLRPRDQAKLGQVMLSYGLWRDEPVLSEDWVDESLTPRGGIHEEDDYCYAWWRKELELGSRTIEAFYASGNGGQFIILVPEFDVLVQFSGANYSNFPIWYANLTSRVPEYVLGAIDELSPDPVARGRSDDPRYLVEPHPGEEPRLFAPGVASRKDVHEFGSVFSEDGLEYFYGVDVGGRTETRSMKYEDGAWSSQATILQHEVYGYNDPFLSPDEERLYVISDSALDGTGPAKDHDIWFVERYDMGWSEPINVGDAINTTGNEYYMSFTDEGAMYFGSNRSDSAGHNDFDLFVSRMSDGEFQPAQRLPGEVNSAEYEADICVARDESYVIFCSSRKGTLGRGDLYVSFRRADGTWEPAQNLGPTINSRGHELCPFITVDGEFLFYTSDGDIYWVSTSILDDLQ